MVKNTKWYTFCCLLWHMCRLTCSAIWNGRCVDRGTALFYSYTLIKPHGVLSFWTSPDFFFLVKNQPNVYRIRQSLQPIISPISYDRYLHCFGPQWRKFELDKHQLSHIAVVPTIDEKNKWEPSNLMVQGDFNLLLHVFKSCTWSIDIWLVYIGCVMSKLQR